MNIFCDILIETTVYLEETEANVSPMGEKSQPDKTFILSYAYPH